MYMKQNLLLILELPVKLEKVLTDKSLSLGTKL